VNVVAGTFPIEAASAMILAAAASRAAEPAAFFDCSPRIPVIGQTAPSNADM
jgi:hypothetical protein